MKRRSKLTILALGLLASGALRLHWEAGFSAELRADGLLAKKVEMGTRDKIGQTSSAVALGGLRTLVATFLNLRAFSFFEAKRWDELAEMVGRKAIWKPSTPQRKSKASAASRQSLKP